MNLPGVAIVCLLLAACATSGADERAPIADAPQGPPALEYVKPDELAIDGIVLAPDGTPVEGAQVLVQLEVQFPMPRTVRALTGADGRFRVAVPQGRPVVLHFVTPTAPPHGFRFPLERVRGAAGGGEDLIVRLRAGQTIAGRVVDAEGAAVAGLPLCTVVPSAMSSGQYVAAESVTASDGSFAFDGLAAGFAAIAEERAAGSIAEHVLLDSTDIPTGRSDLVLSRFPLAAVSGSVLRADGEPVADRTVVLARRGASLNVESRTDAAGRFRAKVAAPGRYVVRLRFATQSGYSDRDMGELDASVAGESTFVAPK